MLSVMEPHINPERKSVRRRKQKTFDYNTDCRKFDPPTSDSDVVFFVGTDVYRGHQYIFAEFSEVLKKYFGIPDTKRKPMTSCYAGVVRRLTKSSHSSLSLSVDAPSAAFEAVHGFCYSGKLSVPVELVPAVYTLASRLQIEVLQSPCAEYLAEHITAANIGEICHVVQFTPLIDETFDKTSDRLLPAERRLAQSVFAYIKENADTIACSLSGQLGARLIVNLTVECSGSCISANEGENLPQVDSQLAFAVLLWAHERAVSGERLARTGSEENVQPDDEESDSGGSASGSTAYGPKPKRPGEPSGFFERMHVLSGVSANSANLNKDHNLSSVLIRNEAPNEMHLPEPSKYPLDTPDVRITLDVDELPSVEAWRSGLATFGDSKTCHNGGLKKQAHLLQCPPNAYPESETCLLAPTSLGVKATSIWLGKLVGYLVSLSIKLYRPNSAVSTPSSSRSSVRHQFSERRRADCATRPTGISPSDSVNTFSSSDENQSVRSMGPSFDLNDEEVSRTMTAVSASSLAKAAFTSLSMDDTTASTRGVLCPNGDEATFGHTQMLEARAGFSGGSLTVCGKDYLLVVGGFTRKGCLESVELYTAMDSSEPLTSSLFLNPPIQGPRLNKPRGRLAVACSQLDHSNPDSGVLYACGGSTGSMDLNSVEKLTPEALGNWLCTWHQSGDSTVKAQHTPTNVALPNASAWTWIAKLHQPRSSPAAVGLSSLMTGPAISDTRGSILVAGGVSGATATSTVEAYVADRDQWITLPNMCEDRSEGACSLLTSKNLVVIAGGNSSTYRRNMGSGIVEALDPRCSTWMSLPSPVPGGQGKLRGSALIPNPSNQDELLLLGGFNGQDTLNSIWVFDSKAWRWRHGLGLTIARASFCSIPYPNRPYAVVYGGFNATASLGGFLDSVEVILTDEFSSDSTDRFHYCE